MNIHSNYKKTDDQNLSNQKYFGHNQHQIQLVIQEKLIKVLIIIKLMQRVVLNWKLVKRLGYRLNIYRAQDEKNEQQVVIKTMDVGRMNISVIESYILNEISIHQKLKDCLYVAKYINTLKTVDLFHFVYQSHGVTLEEILQIQRKMSEKTVLQYLKQFIEFFKIIKQNNLVHCAFKPSNIFIRDGQFKTLSFSCNYDPFYQEQITTADPNYPVYDAPEIYRNRYQRNNHYGNFAKKADIWSLGVVMIEMLLGQCPTRTHSIRSKFLGDLKLSRRFDKTLFYGYYQIQISPILEKLLQRMLIINQDYRISWQQIFRYEITESGQISLPFDDKLMKQDKQSSL